jgi:hypothetical protein
MFEVLLSDSCSEKLPRMSLPLSLRELLSVPVLVSVVVSDWLVSTSTALVALDSLSDSLALPDRLLLVVVCVPLEVAVSVNVVAMLNGCPASMPPLRLLVSCTRPLPVVASVSLLEPVISLTDSEPLFVPCSVSVLLVNVPVLLSVATVRTESLPVSVPLCVWLMSLPLPTVVSVELAVSVLLLNCVWLLSVATVDVEPLVNSVSLYAPVTSLPLRVLVKLSDAVSVVEVVFRPFSVASVLVF